MKSLGCHKYLYFLKKGNYGENRFTEVTFNLPKHNHCSYLEMLRYSTKPRSQTIGNVDLRTLNEVRLEIQQQRMRLQARCF
jgi:hypothetical protein